MNIIHRADGLMFRLMDGIGVFLQTRARLPRYYLVPGLLLLSLVLALSDDVGHLGVFTDHVGSLMGFLGLLFVHFVSIHPSGPGTQEAAVNLAVTSLRASTGFFGARVFCFCLCVVTMLLQALYEPLRAPVTLVEFLLMMYSVMIFQREPTERVTGRLKG